MASGWLQGILALEIAEAAGRPRNDRGLRDLIRRAGQSTVSKYMVLGLHQRAVRYSCATMPMRLLRSILRRVHRDLRADVCFLVLGYDRRQSLWFEVMRHPTAQWLARQITKAFSWDSAPGYLSRDKDRVNGRAFLARVRAMGIHDCPICPGSPRQTATQKVWLTHSAANAWTTSVSGSLCRSLVDCITNMSGYDFRDGHTATAPGVP